MTRTLDNWTRQTKEETEANRRKGMSEGDKLAEQIRLAASKDSTIITEWEGEGY